MQVLKTRKGATLVLLLAVAFGILFGTYRSTMAEKKRVEAVFQEEMVELFQLRADAGYNLCSIASRYLDQDEKFDEHLTNGGMIAAMRQYCDLAYTSGFDVMYDTPNLYFQSNNGLTYNMPLLIEKLETKDLSDADAQHVRSLMQELNSWNHVIANNEAYHSAAAQFNEKILGGLGKLLGIKPVAELEKELRI